ncbi:hypothetical protein MED16_gp72 [Pantoea phage vB_PagS_MED16]|nr:hypothetical protein MED16_gp72 [Pantoea phage vB_PagS_MED16]
MSNYKPHLDAAKQVCLTALHHLDHGLIVAVKQHSGSVVDDPSEPARIILTLELEALDLSVNHHRDDKIPALAGMALEEAKRLAMDEMFGSGPKLGRGSRLATGEESGDDSLRKLDTSKLNDVSPVPKWVMKVPALTRDDLVTIVYNAGLGLTTGRLDSMIDSIMLAQDEAMRGDE